MKVDGGRANLFILRNWIIGMEYIHSAIVGREKIKPIVNQEGEVINKEDTLLPAKMVLTVNFFTPNGLSPMKLRGDTEVEVLNMYGIALKQLGVSDEEVRATLTDVTNEMHPDTVQRALTDDDLVPAKNAPADTSVSTPPQGQTLSDTPSELK